MTELDFRFRGARASLPPLPTSRRQHFHRSPDGLGETPRPATGTVALPRNNRSFGQWIPACRQAERRLASGLLALLVLTSSLADAASATAPSVAAATAPAANDSGLHTFTNTQGVSMKATVASVSGDEVRLTRDDGQKFTVTISIFSMDDQAYIRQWAAAKDNTVPTTATAPSLAEAPEAPTPATAPSSDASAMGAAEAGSPHAPTLAVFPTLTDADVHTFTTKYEVLYLTIESIDGEQVIAREWKITDLSGKVLPETHRLDLKDFTLEDQARIKALVAQRAQDMAAKQNIPGNDGAVHIVFWKSVVDTYLGSSHIPPYLVDASGVLKGKTITAIAGNYGVQIVMCSDGTLAAWGDNLHGQLGNGGGGFGEFNVSPVPVDLSALKSKKVTAIKVFGPTDYLLCADGSIFDCGGGNPYHNMAGHPPERFDLESLNGDRSALKGKQITDFAGEFSLVSCSDGTMWATDQSKYVQVNATGVLKGKTIAAISLEGAHYMVLCTDGTIVHWGFCAIADVYGPGRPRFDYANAITEPMQNPSPSSKLQIEQQLSSEDDKLLSSATPALLADNTGILKGKTVIAIADSEKHFNIGVRASGSKGVTTCWVPADESTILALCSDGTVACWGAGRDGPFPFSVNDDPALKDALQGKTVKIVQNSGDGFLLACSDGTLVHWLISQAEVTYSYTAKPFKIVSPPTRVLGPETAAAYDYFKGKTILGMDSNAAVFK